MFNLQYSTAQIQGLLSGFPDQRPTYSISRFRKQNNLVINTSAKIQISPLSTKMKVSFWKNINFSDCYKKKIIYLKWNCNFDFRQHKFLLKRYCGYKRNRSRQSQRYLTATDLSGILSGFCFQSKSEVHITKACSISKHLGKVPQVMCLQRKCVWKILSSFIHWRWHW